MNDDRLHQGPQPKHWLFGFLLFLATVLALAQIAWSEETNAEASAQIVTLGELQTRARDGDSIAQFHLGVLYATGQGVIQSDIEAMKWYRKSAEQGNPMAQSNLGVFYAQGKGSLSPLFQKNDSPTSNSRRDYVESYKWFALAAEQGLEGAAKNRDRAAERMTPEQIEEAKRRAQEFAAELQKHLESKTAPKPK